MESVEEEENDFVGNEYWRNAVVNSSFDNLYELAISLEIEAENMHESKP